MELLLFGFGKVAPDGGSINIAALVAIFEYGDYILGKLSIIAGNGGTDKAKAFVMGGEV